MIKTKKASEESITSILEPKNGVVHNRVASLTDCEMAVLSALFLDGNNGLKASANPTGFYKLVEESEGDSSSSSIKNDDTINDNNNGQGTEEKVLNNEMLFSVPTDGIENLKEESKPKGSPMSNLSANLLGLWRAHEEKVNTFPERMRSERLSERQRELAVPLLGSTDTSTATDGGLTKRGKFNSIRSDVEVRHEKSACDDDDDDSSWAEDEGGFEHYDAWEVLKDEYAGDFGFDYGENEAEFDFDDDCQQPVFRILGTSANDSSAHPHVLSPPLMEALLNFVPDGIAGDNLWLKYSLIRDGASLETLKRYSRASPYTIMAIETTEGQVFGSFTSSNWRNRRGFYGSSPAFLWKMRHNRRTTPCYSLFEQAQMESEVDIFSFSGLNDLVQVCDNHRIAVGGGKLTSDDDEKDRRSTISEQEDGFKLLNGNDNNFGFGIALNEELSAGTSSPCGTFRNPSLSSHSHLNEVFQVANIEIWTFTPCFDVASAEQLEMNKYFISETVDGGGSVCSASSYDSAKFCSKDLFQKEFYRRIGDYDEHGAIRDRWNQQYIYSKGGGY